MYRLFFAVFAVVFCMQKTVAMASDYVVELGKPKNASLEVIGKKPPKRFIDLELGDLRTRNARLPDGERDLKARIRLRNRRALERQKASSNPSSEQDQEAAKAGNGENSAAKTNKDKKKAKPKKNRKKAKKASKRKPKKKKTKKAKKSKKNKSTETAKVDAKQTKPVKIE